LRNIGLDEHFNTSGNNAVHFLGWESWELVLVSIDVC